MGARAVLVVNPAAAGGAMRGEWPGLAREVRALGLEASVRLTERPGHATALTREALAAGEELVVAVGGDGTVNEVVNGFAAAAGGEVADGAALGVLQHGTGADLVRTYGIPTRPRDAVRLLVEGRERRIDVGRVRCSGPSGPEIRLFANAASAGVTGDVARRASTTSRRLGGTAAFLAATVAGLRSWRNGEFRIDLDGDGRTLVATAVLCANGRYLAGGMHIAPQAEPDDGLFDVVIVGDVGTLDLALNVHRLYRGTLAAHPRVEIVRARSVRVETERPMPVETDGEQPGVTPVTFENLPRALRLLVPAG